MRQPKENPNRPLCTVQELHALQTSQNLLLVLQIHIGDFQLSGNLVFDLDVSSGKPKSGKVFLQRRPEVPEKVPHTLLGDVTQ